MALQDERVQTRNDLDEGDQDNILTEQENFELRQRLPRTGTKNRPMFEFVIAPKLFADLVTRVIRKFIYFM